MPCIAEVGKVIEPFQCPNSPFSATQVSLFPFTLSNQTEVAFPWRNPLPKKQLGEKVVSNKFFLFSPVFFPRRGTLALGVSRLKTCRKNPTPPCKYRLPEMRSFSSRKNWRLKIDHTHFQDGRLFMAVLEDIENCFYPN